MRFSEQWLRQWVNPSISTQELARQLTMAGLEVDAVEPAAPAFRQVVVGEVVAVEPHPDADKLRVCRVNVGGDSLLNIVCGAPNVAEGMRVPTALVGAELPGGLKIKRAKLRGVESLGMLCSARELGIGEGAGGLMELAADAPAGQDVRELLQLDDHCIELGLTPNRGDCLGMVGLAREVAAINQCALSASEPAPVKPRTDETRTVRLDAAEACPRYLGRVLRGIRTGATTPAWMREALRRSGVRSIHPVVDVTNYVLLELGQPMHAFDLNKLSGTVRARWASGAESVELLDGQTITPDASTLVIADDRGPQALAGIMGGAATAVGDDTADLFLECAFFSPHAMAGRARRYGLHTDSSHRFERGVDPQLQHRAMERATALLLELVGGEAGPVVEAVSEAHLPQRAPIDLRAERIQRLLGIAIDHSEVAAILKRLGMVVHGAGAGRWQVTPPSWRFDMAMEADLIEEVARIYGYNRIPETLPLAPLTVGSVPEGSVSRVRIRDALIDRGYQEAVTYSFVDPQMQAHFGADGAVALANPISSDMSQMRTSLWPGLVQAIRYNVHRQQSRVRLFEVGKTYRQTAGGRMETPVVAGAITGDAWPIQWDAQARGADFFDAKCDVEALLALTGRSVDFIFNAGPHPALHPGQSAVIEQSNGAVIGRLGSLHPALQDQLDLPSPVLLFELELAAVSGGRASAFEPLSKFPSVRRDIAVVVDESVTARQVRQVVADAAGAWLIHLELFDVYRGEGIDSGRKSLALGMTLQDTSRTLTDEEVESVKQRVLNQLSRELGAALRE